MTRETGTEICSFPYYVILIHIQTKENPKKFLCYLHVVKHWIVSTITEFESVLIWINAKLTMIQKEKSKQEREKYPS